MTISDKAAKLFSGLDPIWGGFHAFGRDLLSLLHLVLYGVRSTCLFLPFFFFLPAVDICFAFQFTPFAFALMAKRQRGESGVSIARDTKTSAGKLRSPTGYACGSQ